MGGYAWVTLATNDAYSLGALVLAHSLRRVGTKYELAVLVTPGVTEVMREKLSAVFSVVMEVNVLDSKDEANLALLARPELGITFTKLHCWRLTQYDKCVFLDADTLVVRNCDELFEREELSAAPDVGWPDCFNSGVFVYKPSQQTFASITAFAAAKGSFDGGDQGLLNMYFSDWAHKDISKHLPFIYNMCSTAAYSYLPAFKQFGDDVRIIHFIGITKPWLQYFDTLTGIVQPPMEAMHLQPLLQLWWNIFCDKVHPHLSPVMAGLAGALAQITLGEPRSAEQIALEEHMRKQSWEQGHIDYMGRDSFDNIWKKICQTLSLAPSRLPSPPKEIEESEGTATDKTIKSTEPTDVVDVTEPIKSIDVVDKADV
ncbi:glycogenin 1 isoform X2 [Augochlora pura]